MHCFACKWYIESWMDIHLVVFRGVVQRRHIFIVAGCGGGHGAARMETQHTRQYGACPRDTLRTLAPSVQGAAVDMVLRAWERVSDEVLIRLESAASGACPAFDWMQKRHSS